MFISQKSNNFMISIILIIVLFLDINVVIAKSKDEIVLNGIWGAFATKQETFDKACKQATTVFLFHKGKIIMQGTNEEAKILAEKYNIVTNNNTPTIQINNASINHKSFMEFTVIDEDRLVISKVYDHYANSSGYELTSSDKLFLVRC